jgi:hypothetical protein
MALCCASSDGATIEGIANAPYDSPTFCHLFYATLGFAVSDQYTSESIHHSGLGCRIKSKVASIYWNIAAKSLPA